MTLGNMRALGVQRLIASCLNDACRHAGLRAALRERQSEYIEAADFVGSIHAVAHWRLAVSLCRLIIVCAWIRPTTHGGRAKEPHA